MRNRIYTFNPNIKKKKCEVCGKTFTPKSRVQKYCSEKCYRGVVKDYQKQYRPIKEK